MSHIFRENRYSTNRKENVYEKPKEIQEVSSYDDSSNPYRKKKAQPKYSPPQPETKTKSGLLRTSSSTTVLNLQPQHTTLIEQSPSQEDSELLAEYRKAKKSRRDSKALSTKSVKEDKKKLSVEDLLKLNIDELGSIEFDLDDLDLDDLNRLRADILQE